jgi:hypothetical protein
VNDKKLRSIRKMIRQFQAIVFHSRKEKDNTFTILLKDIILVGHIPEEHLRDYIANEINVCLKRVAGRMEQYLTEVEVRAHQVDLDFFGEGNGHDPALREDAVIKQAIQDSKKQSIFARIVGFKII